MTPLYRLIQLSDKNCALGIRKKCFYRIFLFLFVVLQKNIHYLNIDYLFHLVEYSTDEQFHVFVARGD